MTINSFLNIIVFAAKYKYFVWIEKFISTYQRFLNPDTQEEVLRITKTIIYLQKEEPEKAIPFLGNTKFKHKNLELFSLPIEVKCLFEIYLKDQTYYSTILSKLDSLANSFSEKYKFSEKKKKGYLNFVHHVRQLAKVLQSSRVITNTQKVQKQVASSNQVIHKLWLLEKCDQIISQKRG